MHFHLPKPLHGWREFAGEVGIIVIGVLIALAAEALVQRLDWDQRVHAGRDVLRRDYIRIVANAKEREAEDPCIRARLLQLRNQLNASPNSLPSLGHIGSPPQRPWYPGSWDSLIASDVSTHLPRDEMLAFAAIASQSRSTEQALQQEMGDWSTLYTMVGPARQLTSGEGAQLHKAISDAAYQLNSIRLLAAQVTETVLDTGLLTKADLNEAERQAQASLRGPNAQHICGPILPSDPGRVDAPYDPAVQANPLHGWATGGNR